ncbi:hypothetical protein MAR_020666 [Mya arenaria]|uniref:Uncharacterized protein n=1 Tax=Mya arenaria TaxID=6604 RepID=A0ABY7E8L8_MYAAR|nr:hypothetical protein MAR_020666 [Mya arenaria]
MGIATSKMDNALRNQPYLMCVGPYRYTKGAGEPKVSQFDVALLVYEEVLGLDIPVQHSMGVAVYSRSVLLVT